MQIGVLRVSFCLAGCRSLKEKRQRLGGLRERFGKQVNVAVCESNFQDMHDRAEWTFVAVALTGRLIDQTLDRNRTAHHRNGRCDDLGHRARSRLGIRLVSDL